MTLSRTQMMVTLAAFRDLATPILNAVAETGGPNADDPNRPEKTPENNAAIFGELLQNVGDLSRQVAQQLGFDDSSRYDGVRWEVSKIMAQLVASYFRATAAPMPAAKAEELLPIMQSAAPIVPEIMDVTRPQSPTDTMLPQVRAINHMIPVLSAISRFAFGRPENEVMTEIAEKLLNKTQNIIREFVPPETSDSEKKQFEDGILEALGKIYAESHYAEMDRLLDMPPEERAKYVQSYNNKPPMEPVWQAFDLRVG
ncbi:MAG TPA: hypothetical protein PKW15_05440, partial [Alphaproteobacteria bacterium]|nr:hypothetical protein [Alphaproteobacteria bacterium]